MLKQSRLLLAGLGAALALAAAVSAASASNLSVNTREFRTIWSALSFEGGGFTVVCPLTLLGSFHRSSMAKTAGSLVGSITSGTPGSCQGDGRVTVLRETLPWHATYSSFTGELPEIASVTFKVLNAAFRYEDGIPCLFRTSATEPLGVRATVDANPSNGSVDGTTVLSELTIDLDAPEFLCELMGDFRFRGSGTATTDTGSLIVFRLIDGAPPPTADLRSSAESVVIEARASGGNVTIRNEGNATASRVEPSDGGSTAFDVSHECGTTLAERASCVYTIQVDDRPLSSGTITIRYDDGTGRTREVSIRVEIQGEDANLRSSSERVVIEKRASSGTFTIRNEGNVTASRVEITDEGSTAFDVTNAECGTTLAAGASCLYTIQVDSRPLSSGRITITYNDGTGTTRRVSIGVEIQVALANLISSTERVVIEALAASADFTIRNEGDATANRIEITDEGSSNFDVTNSGCATTLAERASCVYTVAVDDRPLSSGSITISYEDGNGSTRRVSIAVEIRGADPVLVADPDPVVIDAREHNDIVTVTNGGDGALIVTRTVVTTSDAENPDFEATSPGCRSTISAGESCTYIITVNDRPETDGRITVYYRYGTTEATTVIPVDVGGEDQDANLTATPSSVAIERLEANDTFTIRNDGTGTATATINDIAIEASDRERPEFSVSGPGCGLTFVDGASCTYTVVVNDRPQTAGYVIVDYYDGVFFDRETRIRVDIAS